MRAAWGLVALLAGCSWLEAPAQQARLVGEFIWRDDHPSFGGMSGLEVLDGGTRYVAVNDRGIVRVGEILRQDGVIDSLTIEVFTRLRDVDASPIVHDRNDSEGVAEGPNGDIYVSFEGQHRILRFTDPVQPAVEELYDPVFATFQYNAALEAIAAGPDGTIYTLPERSGRADRPFPVLAYGNGVWSQAFTIPRIGTFLAVGADIGPDGLFYLLERDFTGVGFRTRVRRFDLTGGGGEVLLETGNGTHDNLEGISVWENDAGEIIMTMIADDNFKFFQQTEIVEYRIDG